MTEFFKIQCDAEMDIAAYVVEFEKLFADMNTELSRRESQEVPLNCCMGRSWQQWDQSTRSFATSGVA
jgi:hypothetical protein